MEDQGFALLNNPGFAGLMGAAGGLLGAAGPTPYPVGMGGALGAGLGGGMAGIFGAQDALQNREYMQLLSEVIKRLRGEISKGGPLQGTPGIAPPQPQVAGPRPLMPQTAQIPQVGNGLPALY